MAEIIANENDFYADQNGLVHFTAQTQLDSFGVGERMAINGLARAFAYQLGRFKVPAPAPLTAEIALKQIFPSAINLAGQTVALPPFGFGLALSNLQDYDSFVSVEGVTGTITVNLRNGFPVPLGPLRVELRDGNADTVIVAFEHNAEIPPNGEVTRSLDFAGRSFSSNMTPVLTGSSPGSRGALVRIDPESKSRLALTPSAFEVSAARAKIGALTLQDEGEIALGDSLQLVSARVKSGVLALQVQAGFPVRTEVRVTLPDFRSSANDSLRGVLTLQPNGNSALQLDLANYTLRPLSAPFGQQKIRFLWRVRTLNTASELVTITSAASVSANAASSKIVFAQLQGAFFAKEIGLAPQSFRLDVPAGLDSLRLLEAQFEIVLRNGINFPVQTDLRVEGFPERGPKVQLVIRERIAPGQSNGAPVETRIVLQGQDAQNFLNASPRNVRVSGRVWVGEKNYVGSVRATDAVTGTLRFDTPLALVLPAQKVESEVGTLKLEEATRARIAKNLAAGGVMLQLENRLPIEASATVQLARNAAQVFRSPDLVVGPVQIALPTLDPLTGRAVQARRSEAVLALNEKQLELFQTSPLYVGVLLTLPGSNGKAIRIAVDDYMKVQALAQLRLQIDDGTLK